MTAMHIASLQPRLQPGGPGHRFVVYGDCCSGVPGAPHEKTFAAVNAVVQRLDPPPQFVLFTGDEIAGLTPDPDALRAQWRHWLDREMGWLDRATTPLWQTTSNHTTWDRESEAVFREVLGHLPRNGPSGQEGLSYWVRRGDLLLVFVHTLASGLGGEGHVEMTWLREVLHRHADARHRLVLGHHPVHPVNGFSGAYQREIGPEHAPDFWDALVDGGVLAYLCGHILAFDVQVHRGVLQICTAGAGTAHRMPEGVEYLHVVQAALDGQGLRYQVIDAEGAVRETLAWPFALPTEGWHALSAGRSEAPLSGGPFNDRLVAFRVRGRSAGADDGAAQTFLCAHDDGRQPALWIGLRGREQRLAVIVGPQPGRSPHYWHGAALGAQQDFDITVLLHTGMGPGGILCRTAGDPRWSTLAAASPWGAERLLWPRWWSGGHAARGSDDQPFRGEALSVEAFVGATASVIPSVSEGSFL
jgi:hypothetical protein